MAKYIVLVNQYTTPIFLDVVKAFVDRDLKVILFTGNGEVVDSDLSNKIKIVNSIRYRRSNNIARLLTWSFFTLHFLLFTLFLKTKSKILLVTNPPLISWTLNFINYNKHEIYLLIYDIYPDVIVAMNKLSAHHWFIKWWKNHNRKVFNRCKSIITIGDGMKEQLTNYTNRQIHIISNWANLALFPMIEKENNAFIKMHRLENKRIVMYSGNIGLTHNVETLLFAAKQLVNESDIQFVIIGEGPNKAKIKRMMQEDNLKNVLLLPFQKEEDLKYVMSAADIGVVTLNDKATHLSIPSKTYYLLASQSAILCIASLDSELASLVMQNELGKVFGVEAIDDIVKFIKDMSTNQLVIYQQNARNTAQLFTPKNAENYVQILLGEDV